MSDSLIAYAADGTEIAFSLAGVVLGWKWIAGPAARARGRAGPGATPGRLGPWPGNSSDFLLFLCLLFLAPSLLFAVASRLLPRLHAGADALVVVEGVVLHAGILGGIVLYRILARWWAGLAAAPAEAAPPQEGAARAAGPAARIREALVSGGATFLIVLPLVLAASFGWSWILRTAGLPDQDQELVDILKKPGLAGLKTVLVGIATLLVPVTEELVFRGGFFRFMRGRTPRALALFGPAVLFGVLHVNFSDLSGLSSLLPLVMLAVVFSLAYERTGNLGTTIVAHALFNLNTFVLIAAGVGS